MTKQGGIPSPWSHGPSLSPRLQFRVKKEGWGGGGTRNVTFIRGQGDVAVLKAGGKTLTVSVGDGLPRNASECQGVPGGLGTGAPGLQATVRGLGTLGRASVYPSPVGFEFHPGGTHSARVMGQRGTFWGKGWPGASCRGSPPGWL